MAEFDGLFREKIDRVNELKQSNEKIQGALRAYNGRTLTLEVKEDAVYCFKVQADGITYELNPADAPADMFARMNMTIAKKLILTQNLGLSDLFSITHKNIRLQDISFIKSLFAEMK